MVYGCHFSGACLQKVIRSLCPGMVNTSRFVCCKAAAPPMLEVKHTVLQHETRNKKFSYKITNDLVMATPIDSRKSRQTRNAINQAQSHPIEKCRI